MLVLVSIKKSDTYFISGLPTPPNQSLKWILWPIRRRCFFTKGMLYSGYFSQSMRWLTPEGIFQPLSLSKSDFTHSHSVKFLYVGISKYKLLDHTSFQNIQSYICLLSTSTWMSQRHLKFNTTYLKFTISSFLLFPLLFIANFHFR